MKLVVVLLVVGSSANALTLHQLAMQLDRHTGVPAAVLERLAWSESSYRPDAYNPADPSAGLMGLKLPLLRWFSAHFFAGEHINPYNADQSMTVAARYLAWINGRLAYKNWYFAVLVYKTGHLAEVTLPWYWATVSPEIRVICWWVATGH